MFFPSTLRRTFMWDKNGVCLALAHCPALHFFFSILPVSIPQCFCFCCYCTGGSMYLPCNLGRFLYIPAASHCLHYRAHWCRLRSASERHVLPAASLRALQQAFLFSAGRCDAFGRCFSGRLRHFPEDSAAQATCKAVLLSKDARHRAFTQLSRSVSDVSCMNNHPASYL
jgi:hypothetical protein